MKRYEIVEVLTLIWDECQNRNIGSNEAELDFIESVADWHIGILNEPIGLLGGAKKVLVLGSVGKTVGGIEKMALALQKAEAHIEMLEMGSPPFAPSLDKQEVLKLTNRPELGDLKVTDFFDGPKTGPIYTPKRKKFKRR